jgi:hypothetical protein
VALKVPVRGSKSSALARDENAPPFSVVPPANKTLPSGSNAAVCRLRGVVMLPVAENVPVRGSYNSALDWVLKNPLASLVFPPAIKTLPSVSRVAV